VLFRSPQAKPKTPIHPKEKANHDTFVTKVKPRRRQSQKPWNYGLERERLALLEKKLKLVEVNRAAKAAIHKKKHSHRKKKEESSKDIDDISNATNIIDSSALSNHFIMIANELALEGNTGSFSSMSSMSSSKNGSSSSLFEDQASNSNGRLGALLMQPLRQHASQTIGDTDVSIDVLANSQAPSNEAMVDLTVSDYVNGILELDYKYSKFCIDKGSYINFDDQDQVHALRNAMHIPERDLVSLVWCLKKTIQKDQNEIVSRDFKSELLRILPSTNDEQELIEAFEKFMFDIPKQDYLVLKNYIGHLKRLSFCCKYDCSFGLANFFGVLLSPDFKNDHQNANPKQSHVESLEPAPFISVQMPTLERKAKPKKEFDRFREYMGMNPGIDENEEFNFNFKKISESDMIYQVFCEDLVLTSGGALMEVLIRNFDDIFTGNAGLLKPATGELLGDLL